MKLLSLPTSPKLVLRSQLRSAERKPLPPITPVDPKIDRHELPDSKTTADFEAAPLPAAYLKQPANYSDDEFAALATQLRQCKTYAIDAAYASIFQLRSSLPDVFAALHATSPEETILRPKAEAKSKSLLIPMSTTHRPPWRVFVVDRTAFVVFRGTISKWEWLRNFGCLPGLHLGFLRSYHRHAPVILATLEKPNGSGFDRIIVTGHSAGGAIAQLMTRELLRRQLPVAACITFAGPRVFGILSTAHWNSEFKKISHRIVNKHDPVPRTPPRLFAFLHIGRRINRVVDGSNPMRRFWARVYGMWSDALNVFDDPVESSGSFATENEMSHLDLRAKVPPQLSSDPASADTMHGHQRKRDLLTILSNKEVNAKQHKTAMQTTQFANGLQIDWSKPFDEQTALRHIDLTQSDTEVLRPYDENVLWGPLLAIMRVFKLDSLGLMIDSFFQDMMGLNPWQAFIYVVVHGPIAVVNAVLVRGVLYPLPTLFLSSVPAIMYYYFAASWVIGAATIALLVVFGAGVIAFCTGVFRAHMMKTDDLRRRDYM